MNDITFVEVLGWMFSRMLMVITVVGLYFAITRAKESNPHIGKKHRH